MCVPPPTGGGVIESGMRARLPSRNGACRGSGRLRRGEAWARTDRRRVPVHQTRLSAGERTERRWSQTRHGS